MLEAGGPVRFITGAQDPSASCRGEWHPPGQFTESASLHSGCLWSDTWHTWVLITPPHTHLGAEVWLSIHTPHGAGPSITAQGCSHVPGRIPHASLITPWLVCLRPARLHLIVPSSGSLAPPSGGQHFADYGSASVLFVHLFWFLGFPST